MPIFAHHNRAVKVVRAFHGTTIGMAGGGKRGRGGEKRQEEGRRKEEQERGGEERRGGERG